MRNLTLPLAVLILVGFSGCQRSKEAETRDAMSEISAVTGMTGRDYGAALAENAIIDGVTYRPLGQSSWSVAANGKAAVNSVPIAGYRAMTGDQTPVPPGHRRSSVIINVAPVKPLEDASMGELREVKPYLGLRRTVAIAYPDTSSDTLWLPAPYEGIIVCPHDAITQGHRSCQLRLNRGTTLSV
jgi:hypothetical protein